MLLGPEDVVVEEAVAVIGRLLDDLGAADRAVPDEGRHAAERSRRRREAGEGRPELALPVDDILAPEPMEQRVVLVRESDPVPDVLTEPRVDRTHVAAAHHQVDPTAGEMLEHRVVLGDLDRIVRRDQRRRGRQHQSLCLCRDIAEHCRRGGGHEGRVVVLAGGEDVETDLFGLERDGHHDLDALGLAHSVTGCWVGRHVTDCEDPELHIDSTPDLFDPVSAEPARFRVRLMEDRLHDDSCSRNYLAG